MPFLRQRTPAGRIETRWLITFADVISLLLTFFVMMFAMSSVKEVTWEIMVSALSRQLNPDRGWDTVSSLTDRTTETVAAADAADLDYLHAVIAEKTRDHPVLGQALLRGLDGRLVITLPSDLLFASNSAELTDPARHALKELGDTLRHIGNRIDVDGHADPQPIRDGAARPDWELSLDRALAVADGLRTVGYTREIIALGLAHARFDELPTGLTDERRNRLARGLDIVIRESFADGDGNGT
ncbi:MAG: flagellar motor protein MotB [Alphaproteobacteria bacterium]